MAADFRRKTADSHSSQSEQFHFLLASYSALVADWHSFIFMRPSSLGGGRILRRTLSVCPSVPCLFTLEPSYERTSKIEKLRFSLIGQRHVCTFRHAQRAAYRTAISAAQILVLCPNNARLVGCGMGMGFAPTWLRQVSPPASHDHFNHWDKIRGYTGEVREDS